jgi:hypothetical protein
VTRRHQCLWLRFRAPLPNLLDFLIVISRRNPMTISSPEREAKKLRLIESNQLKFRKMGVRPEIRIRQKKKRN